MANPEQSSEKSMAASAVTGVGNNPFVAPSRRSEAQRAESIQAVAELTERAREIARDASTALVSAFKDVVADPATAGELSVESTRDLVQYLQRRGQITADDAERLIRSAESMVQRRPARSAKPSKDVKPARAATPAKSVKAVVAKSARPKAPAAKPARSATTARPKPAAKKPSATAKHKKARR